jgi:hypothetical protein
MSWIVLSGYRGDQTYYEERIFSCSGRVANVLAIARSEAVRERLDLSSRIVSRAQAAAKIVLIPTAAGIEVGHMGCDDAFIVWCKKEQDFLCSEIERLESGRLRT